jgi:hypothetical protein
MQDASINDSNNGTYGNGFTGQGLTALNSAGEYEFVTATGAVGVGGGSLTIIGAGPGGGVVFGYDSAAATATKGQSTYQVVLIPQYTTATLGATGLTASPWNGSTGGVLALDTSSTLTLNGATVAVDGDGFRGGAGMELTGGGGANTDYRQPAPATYTGVAPWELTAAWPAALPATRVAAVPTLIRKLPRPTATTRTMAAAAAATVARAVLAGIRGIQT